MGLKFKPIVSLQNVSKCYGHARIIQDLSMNFDEGKFICLLGSSGSGKTTILRLIAGLEKLNRGKILLYGNLVNEDQKIVTPPAQREIGFIFQDLALWPHLTVHENISLGMKLKKMETLDSKVSSFLEFFGITAHSNKYPNQLSGGQQQLVAIARSLVLNPKILLMDEPLANLDVKLKSRIRHQIKSLIDNFSVTIIYVTHDHREALQLADEIIVLNQGKIEQIGTPQEIQDSSIQFVREFIEV